MGCLGGCLLVPREQAVKPLGALFPKQTRKQARINAPGGASHPIPKVRSLAPVQVRKRFGPGVRNPSGEARIQRRGPETARAVRGARAIR